MTQLKRIIVGHDLQAGGEIALQSAVAFAQRSGAALKVVHVVEPYSFYQRLSHPFTPPYTMEELTQRAGATLETLTASPELAPLRVEYEVRTGKPFIQLILAHRAWQGDIIVVGGAAPGEDQFLGSTSERIVRKALAPVLVAKTPLRVQVPLFLVPTDFSGCARHAAETAVSWAESFGGRIVFLHVLELNYFYAPVPADKRASPPPSPLLTPADLEWEWEDFLSDWPALENVSWEQRTVDGRAAPTIIQEAAASRADLIVMGTHGRSNFANMLVGSVAEAVVRRASCSILTVKPEAFHFELP